MSDVQLNQDPKTNQFLPGNVWRYRPGQSGHPARYNYKSMRLKVIEYVQQQAQTDKRYTWSGLAVHLGMARSGLDGYRHGKFGKDKTAIMALLDYYTSAMESQLESSLTDKQYATQGVIKALTALDPERWGDKQTVDIKVQQQISMVISDMPTLSNRFAAAGVTIDHNPDKLEVDQ